MADKAKIIMESLANAFNGLSKQKPKKKPEAEEEEPQPKGETVGQRIKYPGVS